jgi:WD40 repeat protein
MLEFTFIHISDLHFEESNFNQSLILKAFMDDLTTIQTELNFHPDFVIFSGDLVNKGDHYPDYVSAKINFIDKLLAKLHLESSHFFITPGNHDIQTSVIKERFESALNAHTVNTEDIDSIIDLYDTEYEHDVKAKFNNYHKFLTEFNINANALSKSNIYSTHKLNIEGASIGIACLNTSLRTTGYKENYDYGKLIFGSKQINLAVSDFKDCKYKIANFHHPFEWLTDIEKQDVKRIIKREFDLIVFGHNHSASAEHVTESENECISINAGALYEHSKAFVGYSIIQVYSNETKVHLRTYFKDRNQFDIAIDKIKTGTFLIPKKTIFSKPDRNFSPRMYPLEEVKSLFHIYGKLNETELFTKLEKLRKKTFLETGYHGSAIASLLISQNKVSLKGTDLSHLCLRGTDFTGADLTAAVFVHTDLSHCFFSDVTLDNANFNSVNLEESQFIEIENKRAVDFSFDNQVISGGSSGAIINWNSKVILRGHSSTILDLHYSNCKKYLASSHDNGMIFIWEPSKSIEPIKVLRKHENPVYTIGWNPFNTDELVSNGTEGSLNIWDWKNFESPKEVKSHKKEILTLDFNTYNKTLLTSGIDRRIVLWDTRDWIVSQILPMVHKDYIRAVKWKNERFFASCSDDGRVYIWFVDKDKASPVYYKEFDSPILSIAWHPILDILVCGLRDDTVVFWDLENMTNIQSEAIHRIKLHVGRVWDVNWDHKGEVLASAGNEGSIILWNDIFDQTTKKLKTAETIKTNTQILNMKFSCNGLRLKNLKGIGKGGYQTFSNKDRDWDVQECSLQEWLLSHSAELD